MLANFNQLALNGRSQVYVTRFTARRYASAVSYVALYPSLCPSVCLSVCLSVTSHI